MICEYEYWEHRKPIILLNLFIILFLVVCNVACCKNYVTIFSHLTFSVILLYSLFFIYVGTYGPSLVGTTDWFWLAPIFVLPFTLFCYSVAHKISYVKSSFKSLWVTWMALAVSCVVIIVELAAENSCDKQFYYLIIPIVVVVVTMRDFCYCQTASTP